jgi:hypothetical protein
MQGNRDKTACRFTGEAMSFPDNNRCDSPLLRYLSCEYFSRWYWGEKPKIGMGRRRRKAKIEGVEP